jgi:hypothetical protein
MAAPSGSAFSSIDVTRMSHRAADDQVETVLTDRNEPTRKGCDATLQGGRVIVVVNDRLGDAVDRGGERRPE